MCPSKLNPHPKPTSKRRNPYLRPHYYRDDVNELMELVNTLRGFPSHPSKDVFGHNVKLELNTMEIQYANQEDDPVAGTVEDVADEQKDDFKRIADSIEALARTFAKQDSAI